MRLHRVEAGLGVGLVRLAWPSSGEDEGFKGDEKIGEYVSRDMIKIQKAFMFFRVAAVHDSCQFHVFD
jgi:hypothetical protein